MSKIKQKQSLYSKKYIPPLDPARVADRAYAAEVHLKGGAAALFIRVLAASLRYKRIGFEEELKVKRSGRPMLLVGWHYSQMLPLFEFRNKGVLALTSLSRDGDILATCMACLGNRPWRGSSSRGGANALLYMIREMKRGSTAALMVDGPRGPARIAKPGVVKLAQKADALVLPIGVACSKVIRLNSWDNFEIPMPFSKAVVATGEPFEIARNLNISEGIELVKKHIDAAEALARVALGA